MNTRSKHPITLLFTLCFWCFFSFIYAQSDPGRPDQQPTEDNFRAVAQIISDSFGAPVTLVEEFIREAKALEKEEGIPATAFIGIAILESTGFTSYLYQNAKNPFGMRATKIWKGPTFVMWHEGADAPFRKYDSTRSSVRDFAAFLNSRQWFRDALACPTDDLECFLKAMSADPAKKEPGYAADPEWPNKVRRVIKKYGLDRLR
ncbi:MAG: glucosaminidase domain-containing protein [Saprospiraceae bacterium]|nr:glucosaminidase domain-containing protein [Saprospiraceae bacterium]